MFERDYDGLVKRLDAEVKEIKDNIDRWLEEANSSESVLERIKIMDKVVRTTKAYVKLENKRRSLYYKKLKRNQKILVRKFINGHA